MDNAFSNKVILTVAPISHSNKQLSVGCRNPTRAEDVAAEVINRARAGASMVHLHVRDETGEQTFDLDVFRKTLDLFTAKTNAELV